VTFIKDRPGLGTIAAVVVVSCGAPGASANSSGIIVSDTGAQLRIETFVSRLDTPWDLAWGPDGRMWVTERGGRIVRVDPETGAVTTAGSLDVLEAGESGLMGLAFHPAFDRSPFVYAAHSYGAAGGIRNRLVRMRWDGQRLGAPEVLLDGIPGNRNHDGARLAFGPDGMLYMTTGDAGRSALAQDRGSLAGKILRLSPDGRPAEGNPLPNGSYSIGHRNPQGLDFQPGTNALYITEHGPNDNDEVSRVERGGNHGWPEVRGFCDQASEQTFCREHDVVEPVTAFTPTVGIAGATFYDADLIPGWRGSFLATSLRGATLFRITLTPDGSRAAATERLLAGEYGRLRDVLVGPDGSVYVATSNRDGRGRPAAEDDRILRIRP
jgi:glucose/arabinose dehydrogenase